MTTPLPRLNTIDFASLDRTAIVRRTLNWVEDSFNDSPGRVLSSESMHCRLRVQAGDSSYEEVGVREVGTDAERFADDTLAMAAICERFAANTDDAIRTHGFELAAGSTEESMHSRAAGVYYVARVTIDGCEHTIRIVAACSGPQAVFSKMFAYMMATVYGAIWVEHMKARAAA